MSQSIQPEPTVRYRDAYEVVNDLWSDRPVEAQARVLFIRADHVSGLVLGMNELVKMALAAPSDSTQDEFLAYVRRSIGNGEARAQLDADLGVDGHPENDLN